MDGAADQQHVEIDPDTTGRVAGNSFVAPRVRRNPPSDIDGRDRLRARCPRRLPAATRVGDESDSAAGSKHSLGCRTSRSGDPHRSCRRADELGECCSGFVDRWIYERGWTRVDWDHSCAFDGDTSESQGAAYRTGLGDEAWARADPARE